MLAEILSHFGLDAAPFETPPDPRFLVVGRANEEAWATLRFIVREGRNGCLLAAPSGCGKTIHARAAAEDLRDGSVLWVDGRGPQDACLRTDVFVGDRCENVPLLERLSGRTRVVVVDNAAELIPIRWNELFYGLDRVAMAGDRCALLVLVDTDRAGELAPGPARQLEQRCLRHVELRALPADGVESYIEDRLGKAGGRVSRLFTELALRRIGSLSGGVPARINILCANAMLEAFSDDASRIFAEHVDRAAQTQRLAVADEAPGLVTISTSASPLCAAPASVARVEKDRLQCSPVPIQTTPARVASLRNSSATIAAVRNRLISIHAIPAHEHRRSPRIRPAKATAILQTPSPGGERRLEYGFPTSLSREGAGVLVERCLEKDAACRLWILDGVGRPVSRSARVIRARPLGLSAGLFELGVEFDEPLPEGAVVVPGRVNELIVA